MKKLLIGLGILIALIVVGAASVLLLVDVNRYNGAVQAQLERQLGRNVTLGRMSLGILPLRFQVENPVIAEDPAFASQSPFIRAGKLDASLSLAALLGGNVDLQSLDLEHPTVELIRNKQGAWNFSTLGPAGGGSSSGESKGNGRGFALERLSIHDGQVAVTDLQGGRGRTVFDHIDLTTRLADRSGVTSATGNLKLNAARFNGVDLGYPIAIEYDVASKPSQGLVEINNAKVLLGKTPVDVAGSLMTNTTPARLNLSIKTGDVAIAEIARLASAFGIAFAPGTNVTGTVRTDVKATGSTATPELTGAINARDLKISGKDVPQPVEVKAIDLALSPSEIRSNDFTATSGKTNVAARFVVHQYTSPSPSVDAVLRAPNATLPEIQSIAKAYGITGLDQIKGNGNLNLDMHAAGPVQSFKSESVMRALNGTMDLNFNDVRISGFNLAHELGAIGGFLGSSSADQKITEIIKMAGHIAVTNGIAHTDDLKAQTALGEISATGTGDLVTEALNMKLSAILSKGSADKVGGGQIGGYMRTVFANSTGDMTIPVIVTGTFKQPKFSPDTQGLVQLQKQKLIPGFQSGQNPADTVKGILGGLLGGKK
jgi:AsmA protein